MEIFTHLVSSLYNLGSASEGSGISGWLPGLFGGTVGGLNDLMKNAVKNKFEEQQQEHEASGDQRLENREKNLP